MDGDTNIIKIIKKILISKFDIKDTSVTYVILGIRISKIHDGLISSQYHYIDKIIDKFDKK